jgi:hypothetical protein
LDVCCKRGFIFFFTISSAWHSEGLSWRILKNNSSEDVKKNPSS